MSIAENIKMIRTRMAEAACSCGRNPNEILLCAATKMNDAQAVQQAIAAGVDCCGENRVQELMQKMEAGAYQGAPVHFIGHLQTNKVRQVVGKVDLIQSVDREKLMSAIDAEARRQNLIQNILLEVNIGEEPAKSGFTLVQIPAILDNLEAYPNLKVRGLMAIPPISQKSGDNRKYFQKMFQLSVDISSKKYDNVCMDFLSMGMSDDFTDAIACGSNMVRLGSAIFGLRHYDQVHLH